MMRLVISSTEDAELDSAPGKAGALARSVALAAEYPGAADRFWTFKADGVVLGAGDTVPSSTSVLELVETEPPAGSTAAAPPDPLPPV